MVYYAIGLLALMQELNTTTEQVTTAKHAAYADDLNGGGKIAQLRSRFDNIVVHCPKYGYNTEPTKSWLITKEHLFEEGTRAFEGAGVNVTASGKKQLGAAIDQLDYKNEFVAHLVQH